MGIDELALESPSIIGVDKVGKSDLALESSAEKSKKKRNKKKKSTPESNSSKMDNDDQAGAVATQADDNEPTMDDKLANVDHKENDDEWIPENQGNCDMGNWDSALEATVEKSKKKKNKNKRMTPGSNFNKIDDDDGVGAVGIQNDDSEPTMTDNLATFDLSKNDGDCKMIDDYIALEASDGKSKKKKNKKKRKAIESTSDKIDTGDIDATETQDGDNEPSMADKLANLDLKNNDSKWIHKNRDSSEKQLLPSADSIHVVLKQALRADDTALVLDCLYNRDDKVISNSVARLNPADIFKLLNSLVFIIQSRGAVLVCALPWLRSLLVQHSSRIVSQESSLAALNSIFQLIESRIATFKPALQLSSSLDLLFAGIDEDERDELESAPPVIYEDDDESDEEEFEDNMMETDEDEGKEPEDFSGISDVDVSDDDLMQF